MVNIEKAEKEVLKQCKGCLKCPLKETCELIRAIYKNKYIVTSFVKEGTMEDDG